jgi:hypothetical protein
VSLDERRAKFKPNLWNRPNETEKTLSISDQKAPQERPHPTKKLSQLQMERKYARDPNQPTDIDEVLCLQRLTAAAYSSFSQVWFSGCHCGK